MIIQLIHKRVPAVKVTVEIQRTMKQAIYYLERKTWNVHLNPTFIIWMIFLPWKASYLNPNCHNHCFVPKSNQQGVHTRVLFHSPCMHGQFGSFCFWYLLIFFMALWSTNQSWRRRHWWHISGAGFLWSWRRGCPQMKHILLPALNQMMSVCTLSFWLLYLCQCVACCGWSSWVHNHREIGWWRWAGGFAGWMPRPAKIHPLKALAARWEVACIVYLLFLCGVWWIFLCRASEAFEILNWLCMSNHTSAWLKHEHGAHAVFENGPQSAIKECINNLQREFSFVVWVWYHMTFTWPRRVATLWV